MERMAHRITQCEQLMVEKKDGWLMKELNDTLRDSLTGIEALIECYALDVNMVSQLELLFSRIKHLNSVVSEKAHVTEESGTAVGRVS